MVLGLTQVLLSELRQVFVVSIPRAGSFGFDASGWRQGDRDILVSIPRAGFVWV